jgi:ferrochelatase
MGGPNNLDEVEIFLKNMFNDKNIITVKNNLLRKFISFMIVNFRKKQAIENYKDIGGKSPLVDNTKKLIKKLQDKNNEIFITYAMRYTPPFSEEVITKLKDKDIKEVFLLPLYPHFSTTTTKSSLEDFTDKAKKSGLNARIISIQRFYREKEFNKAIVRQIKNETKDIDVKQYDLIFSAHSLPKKIIENGDTYQQEIEEHVKLLSQMLSNEDIEFADIHLAYQSKLGPVKWIGPSLEEKLKTIANKNVFIYPVSFTLDNSETIQELHIEYKNIAKNLEYKNYKVFKCLNDNDDFVEFIHNYYIDKNT